MIIRIVRLSIDPEKTDDFISNFNLNKEHIRSFEGCRHLELWIDKDKTNVHVTYSHWDDEDSLNAYRDSELFKGIWIKTKAMFNGKPEAWTLLRA